MCRKSRNAVYPLSAQCRLQCLTVLHAPIVRVHQREVYGRTVFIHRDCRLSMGRDGNRAYVFAPVCRYARNGSLKGQPEPFCRHLHQTVFDSHIAIRL